jgi:hypothetical protein
MSGISTIRRTNNAAEYMSVDGVVIDERKPPSAVIGLPQNKVCIIGEFQRGPVDVVTRIGSPRELFDKFGGVGPDASGNFYKGYLGLVGKTFGRLHVIRLSNSSQVAATVDLDDATVPTAVIRVTADSVGVWGNGLTVSVEAASSGTANDFNLIVKYNSETVEKHQNLNLADVNDTEDLTPGSLYVRCVRLAIGDGRPVNVADEALTTGADGTFADADYTGSSVDVRGIQLLYGSSHADIRWVFVAEYEAAAVNAALLALSVGTKTKNCLLLGDPADTATEALADVPSYRSDRIGYCYPQVKVWVAEANGGLGGLVTVGSNSFAAAVLSGIAPGQNPAGPNGEPFLAGIRELVNANLGTADFEEFRDKGIMGFQFTQERQKYSIRSGINTDLDPALKNWARRTIADYLQESAAVYLAFLQNKPISSVNKMMAKAALEHFLDQQIRLGLLPSKQDLNDNRPETDPILEPYEIDITTLNSQASEANGVFIILARVRTFATMDFIVLRTEIGERVEVTATT